MRNRNNNNEWCVYVRWIICLAMMTKIETKVRGVENTKSFVQRVIGSDDHVHAMSLTKLRFFPLSPSSRFITAVGTTIQR